MNVKSGLSLFLFLILPFSLWPEQTNKEENSQSIYGLVDLITTNQNVDSLKTDIPLSLLDIINAYYAEAVVPESVATEVLSYFGEVYSEHGYHETGNWAENRSVKVYNKPLSLPDFEYSEFQLPTNGRLTSQYGYRAQFRRFHKGIDLSLNIGDTVKCALPGMVTTTGYDSHGYGRYVIVTHAGGLETLYGHLNNSFVSPGQKIQAGEALGLGGTTGNSTGPHLHFETRYRGTAIDPISWFELTGRER